MERELQRLLEKEGIDPGKAPEKREWQQLLQRVGEVLEEERRRYQELERSVETSSLEIIQMLENSRLQYEERLKALLETVPDFILLLDEEGRCLELYTGRDTSPVPGLERGKLLGRRLSDILPPEQAEEIMRAHRRARGENRVVTGEVKLDGKNGPVLLDIHVRPITGDHGGREATVVVLREREEGEEFLSTLKILKRVADESKEGMFIVSKQGDLLYHNEAFRKIFDGKVGTKLKDYKSFFSSETYRLLRESIKKSGAFRGEVMVHREDGTQVPVWLTLETIADPDKNELYQFALFSNIAELRRSQVALQHSATHDTLTGLPNRQALMSHLEETLERAIRYRHNGALFFIDLDNFKEINDSMGHLTGDAVLIEVASRIKTVIRKSDIFGRLGGDEFLLIVEEISSPDALMHIATKIIEVINRPIAIGQMNYTVGASIGITIFPHDSINREELLRYADMAMYRAKDKGKNRYQFYSSGIDRSVKKHFNIEKALRAALEEGGFYLVFQPQIDMATDTITGVEALLRLESLASSEKMMPDDFIPIAEESDIILHIGRWVFTRCCQILSHWQRSHNLPFLQMSINLSRRQLIDNEWVDFVAKTMRSYRIDPRQIEFEITETAFMHSGKRGLQVLRQLQDLGCKLSIDDFGTGYSSLSSLKEFTVDRLKIDRSFIQDITHSDTDRAIVKASIAMAQALGLKTVAEGVETAEQKKMMKLMGCKEMQGFLYGKPVPADEVLRIILASLNRTSKKPYPF